MQHSAPPRPGQTLGRFLLERELGRGRSGVVFLAVDTLVKQRVALKVLAGMSTPAAIQRAHREVSAARRLAHKGLRAVFDVHEVDGWVLVAMDFIEGTPLRQVVARGQRLPVAKVLPWIRTVADALDAAHRASLVHGALTIRDVLVRADGTACVLGIGDTSAASGVARGAAIPAQEDVRATVSILVEALTGQPLPAPGSPPLLLSAARPDAPRALDDIVRHATARDDARAFSQMSELVRALDAVLSSMGIAPARETSIPMPIAPMAPLPAPAWAVPTEPHAHRLESASTRLRDELPPDATLPLSDLPPLVSDPGLAQVDQGSADASASWVVGGRAVDLPARPKSMNVVTEAITEPVRRRVEPTRSRATWLLAGTLVVVGASAGVLAYLRHQESAPIVAAAQDAGPVTGAAVTAPIDREPTPGVVDAGAPAPGPRSLDELRSASARLIADKGLLAGDDVEVDRLNDRIAHPADLEDAAEAFTALEARLAQVPIDKKLVQRKLGRLRVEARSQPSAKRRALERALDEAAALLAAERAIDANAKLNEAFASGLGAG